MFLLLSTLMTAPAMVPGPLPTDTGRTKNGVTMAETIEIDGHGLSLNGMALRKKVVFKVYVAGLYLATPSHSADAILAADEPRRMVMHFVRTVDKKKICEGWDEGLEKNTPGASEALKAQFTELCGLMVDIKDGQEFVFTYTPGSGTAVESAGEAKGTIPGKEFADAILGCWIGPKPGPGDGFKRELLGQS
jgi:hypothetical protein